MKHRNLYLLVICILGAFLRFWKLENIPAGLYVDEASHGYNSYSLATTGKDEYGKSFPIFLRSFNTFASPLYAYLSVIPIKILGLSIFSTRVISAISGTGVIILTYLILNEFSSSMLALTVSLIIAISPWGILLSRSAFEPNLGLLFMLLGIWFLLKGLTTKFYLVLGAISLAISGYGYHGERLISPLILLVFLRVFRENFKNHKQLFILLPLTIGLIQLPQYIVSLGSSANVRLTGQTYINHILSQHYQSNVAFDSATKLYLIGKEFASQYVSFFSPRNLFFDPDPDMQRSIPELSVLYIWMVIPFLFGIQEVKRNLSNYWLLIIWLCLLSPVPAALTKDPFSTMRAIPVFWGITIFVSVGLLKIATHIKNNNLNKTLLIFLVIVSLLQLYSSYFVLLRYERSKTWGSAYEEFVAISQKNPQTRYILETTRDVPSHILLAFYTKVSPETFQSEYGHRSQPDYYRLTSQFDRTYTINNVTTRSINWERDIYEDQVLVGDTLSISDAQAQEHYLIKAFEIPDLTGTIQLVGFKTNPTKKCSSLTKKERNKSPCPPLTY